MLDTFKKRSAKQLKKQTILSPDEVFFVIGFDKTGATISAHADKTNSVYAGSVISPGPVRELLKRMDTLRQQEYFVISWEDHSDEIIDKISLTKHPELILLLKECPLVVDESLQKLFFSNQPEIVTAKIENISDKPGMLRSSFTLSQNQPITAVLSQEYVLSGNTIFEIAPLGIEFNGLQELSITFSESFLQKYLSIVTSHIPTLTIYYADYQSFPAESTMAKPALLIDEVGENKELHLRLSLSAAGIEPDFFSQYEITKVVRIYDEEKKITVHELVQDEVINHYMNLTKILSGYQKSLQRKGTFWEDESGITITEDLARIFLEKELGNILSHFHVSGTSHLKKYRIHTTAPKLNLSLTEGINFLEGNASLEIAGKEYGIFDVLRLYKTHTYIPLSNGEKAVLNTEYVKKLQRLFQKEKNGKVKVSFFDFPIIDQLLDEKMQKEWVRYRSLFSGFNTLTKQVLKLPRLGVKLRDYQHDGVKWLSYLYTNNLNGCLADDMGLGKTIQTIVLLSLVSKNKKLPTLVVVPKSLLFNWEREFVRIYPKFRIYLYYGVDRAIKKLQEQQVILTTYQTLRMDIDILKAVSFDTIILDESGNIKNPDSQVAKAVGLLSAKHRFALSGTPIENNLNELYSLFRFLEPAMFRNQSDFLHNYLYPIQKENDMDALAELRRKIYPFILRRTKQQVLKELPDKIEQIVYVDLPSDQAALYEARRKYYYETVKNQLKRDSVSRSQFFIFQALSELRQIVSCPEEKTEEVIHSAKREILKEQLEDALGNGHKVIIFTQYIQSLENIAADVSSLGVSYVVLSGTTTNREQIVDLFQNDPTYKVFIATLKTGGFGLNLTAADMVFIYDPWWNVAAENQGIDRTHRIGQKNTVFAYRLIARGTIEEKMLQLQKRKARLFTQLISTDATTIKSLSEDDIDFLLQ